MKKYLLLSIISLTFTATNYSQISPPSNADIMLQSGSPANTSCAIAPEHQNGPLDFTVNVVEVLPNSSDIIITANSSLTTIQLISNIGIDPDVTFGESAEMFSVVTYDSVMDEIVYSEYHLTGPNSYSLIIQLTVDQGDVGYPNIDMNSTSQGVITYQKSGDIMVCSFTFGSVQAPALVGMGYQPDVAVQENINEYALTFLSPDGELEIHSNCDIIALQSSNYAMGNQHIFPPIVSFERPRIAVPHNMNAGPSNMEYTVVVADNSDEIWGFFEDGSGIIPFVLINSVTDPFSSYELEPVVAYQHNKVKVAWSSDHGVYNWGTGVLLEEFDFSGNVLTPLTHRQISWGSINFQASNSAIATQGDGNFPVNPGHENESILYHDGVDVYWKNENNSWGHVYKTGNDHPAITDSQVSFQVDNEMKIVKIDITDLEKNTIAAFNSSGQQFYSLQTTEDGIYNIDYSNFPKGIYFVACRNNTATNTIVIHNF